MFGMKKAFLSLLLVSVGCAGLACGIPGPVIRKAIHHSSPGLAGATGPFEMLASDTAPASGSPATAKPPAEKKQATSDKPAGATGPVRDASVPIAALMVPASGDVRARLVRSANRLVGIKKSFDSRSFIGHLLAICDLLPRGSSSMSQKTSDVKERFVKSGKYRKGRGGSLTKGDIVFFRCGNSCGADASDGIGSGILVEDAPGGQFYVAYVNGVVRKMKIDDQLTGSASP